MNRPPSPHRPRPPLEPLTWQTVLVSYALLAVIPFALWAAHRPVAASSVLVAAGGLVVGLRQAHRLVRCVHECQCIAFDLAGTVRIVITDVPTDDPT